MTIKELYHFAINNSLLNKEVTEVIKLYYQSKDINKVEYTTEDLLSLLSH